MQFVTDSKNLSEKSNITIQSLQETNKNIEQLRAEVKRLQEETQQTIIQQYQNKMKTSELLQKGLMGCIGEPFIANTQNKIKSPEQTIHDLKIKILDVSFIKENLRVTKESWNGSEA